MPMVKKSISITEKQEVWIKAQISSGDFGNESEVMRDLIRKEQLKNVKIQAIRTAIIEGEQSGISRRSAQDIRDAVIKRKF